MREERARYRTREHTFHAVMNARRVKRAEVHNSRVRSSLKWGYPFAEASARRIKGGGGRKRKGAGKLCAREGWGGREGRPVKFVATKTAGFMARNLLRFHGKVTK